MCLALARVHIMVRQIGADGSTGEKDTSSLGLHLLLCDGRFLQ